MAAAWEPCVFYLHPYGTWTEERVLDRIDEIEDQMSATTASSSSPDIGMVTNKDDLRLAKALRLLKARLAEIRGDHALARRMRGGTRLIRGLGGNGL